MCPAPNAVIKPCYAPWDHSGSRSPSCTGSTCLTWKGNPDLIAAGVSLDVQQPVAGGNLFRHPLPRVASRVHTRSSRLSARPQCRCGPAWCARPWARVMQGPGIPESVVECAMDGQQDVMDGDEIIASPRWADYKRTRQHMAGDNDLRRGRVCGRLVRPFQPCMASGGITWTFSYVVLNARAVGIAQDWMKIRSNAYRREWDWVESWCAWRKRDPFFVYLRGRCGRGV